VHSKIFVTKLLNTHTDGKKRGIRVCKVVKEAFLVKKSCF